MARVFNREAAIAFDGQEECRICEEIEPPHVIRILQEYSILPHSRTYYCLLFFLYHMFIIFAISY